MKLLPLLLALLLSSGYAYSQSWEKKIANPDGHITHSSIHYLNGHYFLCGRSYDTAAFGAEGMVLSKLDSTGKLIWNKRYTLQYQYLRSFTVSTTTADSGLLIWIYGWVNQADLYTPGIMKITSEGEIVWIRYFYNHQIFPNKIIELAGGNIVVIGDKNVRQFGVRPEGFILTLDHEGYPLEYYRVLNSHDTYIKGVSGTRDGGFIATGWRTLSNIDVLLIKGNKTGKIEWSKSIGDTTHQGGYSVIETTDGFLYAGLYTNYLFWPQGHSLFIGKVSGDGTPQWNKRLTSNLPLYGFCNIQKMSDHIQVSVQQVCDSSNSNYWYRNKFYAFLNLSLNGEVTKSYRLPDTVKAYENHPLVAYSTGNQFASLLPTSPSNKIIVTDKEFPGICHESFEVRDSMLYFTSENFDCTLKDTITAFSTSGSHASHKLRVSYACTCDLNHFNHSTTLCKGDSIVLTPTASGSAAWNTGSSDSIITVTGPGMYVASTLIGACRITDTFHVDVHEPLASFNVSKELIDPGEEVMLNNTSSGCSSFLWLLPDRTSSADEDQRLTFETPGNYGVKLIGSTTTCRDTAAATITVAGLFIPNVLSPNGDGQNDYFHVKGVAAEKWSGSIFNRWGNKVFEFDQGKRWDANGCPDGTYFYIIRTTGPDEKEKEHKGTITVFR